MDEDTEQETCYACEQRRVALWMTASFMAAAWVVAASVLAIAWEVVR